MEENKNNEIKDAVFTEDTPKDIVCTSVFDAELGTRYFRSIRRSNLGFYMLLLISCIIFLVLGFFVANISFVISAFCFLLGVLLLVMHEITKARCLKILKNQTEHYVTVYDFNADGFMTKNNLKDNVSKNYKYAEITKCNYYYNVITINVRQETYIVDTTKFDPTSLLDLLKANKVKINKIF